jgi:hypothetical protein
MCSHFFEKRGVIPTSEGCILTSEGVILTKQAILREFKTLFCTNWHAKPEKVGILVIKTPCFCIFAAIFAITPLYAATDGVRLDYNAATKFLSFNLGNLSYDEN